MVGVVMPRREIQPTATLVVVAVVVALLLLPPCHKLGMPLPAPSHLCCCRRRLRVCYWPSVIQSAAPSLIRTWACLCLYVHQISGQRVINVNSKAQRHLASNRSIDDVGVEEVSMGRVNA